MSLWAFSFFCHDEAFCPFFLDEGVKIPTATCLSAPRFPFGSLPNMLGGSSSAPFVHINSCNAVPVLANCELSRQSLLLLSPCRTAIGHPFPSILVHFGPRLSLPAPSAVFLSWQSFFSYLKGCLSKKNTHRIEYGMALLMCNYTIDFLVSSMWWGECSSPSSLPHANLVRFTTAHCPPRLYSAPLRRTPVIKISIFSLCGHHTMPCDSRSSKRNPPWGLQSVSQLWSSFRIQSACPSSGTHLTWMGHLHTAVIPFLITLRIVTITAPPHFTLQS